MKNITVLLISGPLAVGKTTFRDALTKEYGYVAIQSSTYLKALAVERQIEIDRTSLQALGDLLDQETQYSWVVTDVALPQISSMPGQLLWIVDSVRKAEQVKLFREQFEASVVHVHFTCPEKVLKKRYETRDRQGDSVLYEDATKHSNEVSSRGLVQIADLVVDLDELTSDAAACMVSSWVASKV